jgi:hypothetical protein
MSEDRALPGSVGLCVQEHLSKTCSHAIYKLYSIINNYQEYTENQGTP